MELLLFFFFYQLMGIFQANLLRLFSVNSTVTVMGDAQ